VLKQKNISEGWEERKRKSRNEGVEEDEHVDEKKDCSNVKMAINTCTCAMGTWCLKLG